MRSKRRYGPVNVNYCYLEAEVTHVIINRHREGLVFQAQLATRIAGIRDQLEQIRLFLEIDEGSGEHLEGACARMIERMCCSTRGAMPGDKNDGDDDIHMLYTRRHDRHAHRA